MKKLTRRAVVVQYEHMSFSWGAGDYVPQTKKEHFVCDVPEKACSDEDVAKVFEKQSWLYRNARVTRNLSKEELSSFYRAADSAEEEVESEERGDYCKHGNTGLCQECD